MHDFIRREYAQFDAHLAYEREREASRRTERLLTRALSLLRLETDRRERAGEDVTHIRAFLREANQ